jgi:hypothetical protein
MPTIDLPAGELAAVTAAIRRAIEDDRFPHAPRLDPLRAALARLEAGHGIEFRGPFGGLVDPADDAMGGSGGRQPLRSGGRAAVEPISVISDLGDGERPIAGRGEEVGNARLKGARASCSWVITLIRHRAALDGASGGAFASRF